MAHRSDSDLIENVRNTARFFTETRHVAWVLLAGTVAWGIAGYRAMPQRKDPDVKPREALVVVPWPGASAEKIERLVTERIEETIAENSRIETITSNTRTSVAVVNFKLTEDVRVEDRPKEFDDIKLKLDAIDDLPDGAGPIQFVKDFGDTATLLLTIASPRIGEVEVDLRAKALSAALSEIRKGHEEGPRAALIASFPQSVDPHLVRPHFAGFADFAAGRGVLSDAEVFQAPGILGVDVASSAKDEDLLALVEDYVQERMRSSEFHPDVWPPFLIRELEEVEARVRAAAGDKYSYRELSDFTDLIKRTLQTVPQVSKIQVSGLLEERIYLHYSQERLASYGVNAASLPDILGARNITLPGGILEVGDKSFRVDPSGEFRSEKEIGDVLVPAGSGGSPLYLRDLVDIVRAYDSPPRFLNFYARPDEDGNWSRTRAVTLSIQMRAGEHIEAFDHAVDLKLEQLGHRLPEDLLLARTSDQPRQVEENVHLFMNSLYEAVFLVVLVSLVGFWEWRSALLMALSIPITLAMTFGMMYLLGIDLQQVSIASLIIALGLLVDDPVVAGDAIKRDLAAGHPRGIAAWLGPTKLATAILYATITNIAAYLPFLMLGGETGNFLYSLPIVIASSLVASRLVSMTFIPLLGYYLLRPRPEPSIAERRTKGFAKSYYRLGSWSIEHRWAVLGGSLGILLAGVFFASRLKTQFFPKDLQYLAYVDVWLPEDAPFFATSRAAELSEEIVRRVAREHGEAHPDEEGRQREVLRSLTTYIGGGAPRFWSSVVPELAQVNYAQILMEVRDKHDTHQLIEPLQRALWENVPGATVDVRQLETGAPVGIPLAVRISGDDLSTMRRLASEVKAVFRSAGNAVRVRDNWGAESFAVRLAIDPDRANLAGVTNLDVAAASVAGMNGIEVATLREGDEQIPVVARMRMEERARLGDLQNLYVYSSQGSNRVPLGLISTIDYRLEPERIQRRNQFRTVTVSAFPAEGVLPSEVLSRVMPGLEELERKLSPGYVMEIGGEYEEQVKGFSDLAMVMATSVALIFLALVIQFKHAVKPFIVFAAIPYGMTGALAALWLMGMAFGFMAFLGIASLVGVIVSHIIVLFDFIEEAREHGAPLREALLDAGILRLRPVLITVGATVIALFPLAAHGGPLWEPLCYAQIGGLTAATFITLLLVPVLYAAFVLDLKLVKWER